MLRKTTEVGNQFLILCTPVLHSHVINHDVGILLFQVIVDK